MALHYIKASEGKDGRVTVEGSNIPGMGKVTGGTRDEFLKAVGDNIPAGKRNIGKVDVFGLGKTRTVKRPEPAPRRA